MRWTAVVAVAAQLSAQGTAPVTAEERALLSRWDAAANAGDRESFLAQFAPSANRKAMAMAWSRWLAISAQAAGMRRSSEVVGVQIRDGVRILLVRETDRRAGDAACVAAELALVLAASRPPALHAVVEVEHAALGDAADQRTAFRCPPCNFGLRVPRGWLAVTMPSRTTGCMDTVAVYHLHADISLELAVQVLPPPPAAPATIVRILRELGAEPTLPPRPWLPAAAPDQPPAWLSGAAASADLDGGQRLDLWLLCYDRVCYLLAAQGATADLERQRAAVGELVAGFELTSYDIPPAELAARAARHHAGGEVQGGRYANPRHRLAVVLPPGWTGEQRASDAAFEVVATDPVSGSRLRVCGILPPAGAPHWDESTADGYFERCCGRWLEAADDSGWRHDCPHPYRHASARDGEAERGVRLVRRDDLAIVLQWHARDAASRAAVQAALASLVVD